MSGAYYNEIDKFAAAWLRELIKAGLIADGEVDERSIADVTADDVRGFTQCHWFAGIGGWSLALRLAGWDDARAVWTGSCPCQPFSSAGAQAGGNDSRDLWPVWFQLVTECRPVVVFGEQVEAAIGHGWLDRLCDDLEAEGYAVGACGLPGPCVGAFDIRQRLWFVADAGSERRQQKRRSASGDEDTHGRESDSDHVAASHGKNGMADAEHAERRPVCGSFEDKRNGRDAGWPETHGQPRARRPVCDMADAESGGQRIDGRTSRSTGHVDERYSVDGMEHAEREGLERFNGDGDDSYKPGRQHEDTARSTAQTGGVSFWSECDWLPCTDGKARPVEPGTFPLAHGVSARVGRLRGYGNAIKPQVAQVFIEAYLDATAPELPRGT